MKFPSLAQIKNLWTQKTKAPSYPITALIRCKRGHGSVVVIDRLRRVDRITFQRMSNGHIFEAPDMSEVDIMSNGGNFVELWNPEFKVYVPLRFVEDKDKVGLREANTNYLSWAKNKMTELRLRHTQQKSKLQEMMPIALPMVTAIALGIILWFASENWKQLGPITAAMNNLAATLKQAGSQAGVMQPIG